MPPKQENGGKKKGGGPSDSSKKKDGKSRKGKKGSKGKGGDGKPKEKDNSVIKKSQLSGKKAVNMNLSALQHLDPAVCLSVFLFVVFLFFYLMSIYEWSNLS